jgi:LysM repeat protein
MIASILAGLSIISSCSLTKRTTSSSKKTAKPASSGIEYIEKYKDLAIREMKRTGIPASITLAQGMLESDYGNSRLAKKAKNHFGIKCHNSWSGGRVYHDDDRRNECFRKYNNVYESYRDHSKFLTQSNRYEFLFDYKRSQYKAWAKGLKKAGYATSPTYARKLINLIERYKLYNYDTPEGRELAASSSSTISSAQSLGNVDDYEISHPGHKVRMRNRIDYIIVKRGDTYQSLTEELDLLSWELKKYNDLGDKPNLKPGQILYLQPKRNKAAVGYNYHVVKEGDTMHSISQLYGIKLEELYEKNNMKEGEQVEPGQKLWLRSPKPEKSGDKEN